MSENMTVSETSPSVGEVEPVPAIAAAAPTPREGRRRGDLLASYGLLAAFLLTIAVFCAARPDTFATVENLKAIATSVAPALIVAAGLTIVLVMQDFDLSFGAMIGLASAIVIALMVKLEWPWPLALVAALAAGCAIGALNGFIVSYLGGSSFIITLAMGTILTGLEYAVSGQTTLYQGVPKSYADIAQHTILGFSDQIWIAAVLAIVVWAMLDRTELGRYMYAIGGNAEAARLAGIRTRALRLLGFVLVGAAAAIVGILLSSQSQAYVPNSGPPFLLPAFAAVFLGSAVFRPGHFNLPGTVIGVLFLGVIQTGLTMLNLQTYVINLVQGGILITAVLISRIGQRTS